MYELISELLTEPRDLVTEERMSLINNICANWRITENTLQTMPVGSVPSLIMILLNTKLPAKGSCRKFVSDLYALSSTPQILQLIKADNVHNIIYKLILMDFPADEGKRAFIKNLYQFTLTFDLLHDLSPKNLSAIISQLLSNPLSNQPEKRDFMRTLYRRTVDSAIFQKMVEGEGISLIGTLLSRALPQEPEQRAYYLAIFKNFHVTPEMLKHSSSHAVPWRPALIEKLLKMPMPAEEEVRSFLRVLYQWASSPEVLKSMYIGSLKNMLPPEGAVSEHEIERKELVGRICEVDTN